MIHTYSFKVGHVRCIDWSSNETQVVYARFVGAVLVVLNEHLSAMILHHQYNVIQLQYTL